MTINKHFWSNAKPYPRKLRISTENFQFLVVNGKIIFRFTLKKHDCVSVCVCVCVCVGFSCSRISFIKGFLWGEFANLKKKSENPKIYLTVKHGKLGIVPKLCSSKMSVNIYRDTRRHVALDFLLHTTNSETLRPRVFMSTEQFFHTYGV